MRIELPHPTWADAAQRAHDDAHTLTLPQAAHPLAEPWFPTVEGRTFRIAVDAEPGPMLTLTL